MSQAFELACESTAAEAWKHGMCDVYGHCSCMVDKMVNVASPDTGSAQGPAEAVALSRLEPRSRPDRRAVEYLNLGKDLIDSTSCSDQSQSNLSAHSYSHSIESLCWVGKLQL